MTNKVNSKSTSIVDNNIVLSKYYTLNMSFIYKKERDLRDKTLVPTEKNKSTKTHSKRRLHNDCGPIWDGQFE